MYFMELFEVALQSACEKRSKMANKVRMFKRSNNTGYDHIPCSHRHHLNAESLRIYKNYSPKVGWLKQ
eukprot:CFRG5014T1